MGNKIRIKQIDLQGIFSASSQVDILSASNYASFVTQLDTTMSSDAELSAVSSSISQSIYTINQVIGSGLVSGSSQLTSSYDTRYILSGSIIQTTWDNIEGKPSGLVSESTDLTPLNSFTASYFTDSSSFDTRVLTEKGRIDAILSASNANTDTFAEIVSLINSVDLDNDNAFATFYTSSNARVSSLENATGSYLTSLDGSISSSDQLTGSFDIRYTLSGSVQPLPNGLISGSSQLTSSFDERYTLSSSYSADSSSFNSRFNGLITTGSNTFSGSQVFSGSMTVTSGQVIASTITNNSSSLFLQSGSNLYVQNDGVVEITGSIVLNGTTYTSLTGSGTIPTGTISGSSQLTSSFDTRYTLSGSVQPLPSGLISGSSQLTSSYDTRYTLSGSVVSGTTPAGTISGSAQLTSSFDGRYVQTGSFNSLTASFNSFTASAQSVTTGSNSFNGTQTITGSLIITTGSFVASQILANTASLYLTSGSNMYVQNNGVVEITGSFGVFIDLSKPTGNNNEITYKASGLVNAGDFVQLDNIKATITTTGNRGLSLATVSGTFVCNIAGNYAGAVVGVSGTSGTATITTSASTSIFGWGFTTQGDIATYIITDTTNSRAYRITIQIGGSYLNNLVSIERLH